MNRNYLLYRFGFLDLGMKKSLSKNVIIIIYFNLRRSLSNEKMEFEY
jgi:hypothetical protein